MEELELDSQGLINGDQRLIREIKETDLPFTNTGHTKGWSTKRYLAALLGKSQKAASGAFEYTRPEYGIERAGIGVAVPGLEGEE